MKRATLMLTIAGLAFSCNMDPANEVSPIDPSFENAKNGFNLTPLGGDSGEALRLSGAHYNLNIIGVSKGKSATMDSNNGHRIFVNLDGNTKILLSEGEEFQVLDANGTDQNGAAFQLPNPDPDGDGITEYSVFARALGKPGGSAKLTTCAMVDGEEVCSTLSAVFVREKGGPKIQNVSKELLYIYADLDEDGDDERYGLFDDELEDYFWSYDNNGLKLLQVRFYEVSTNVN